MNAKKTTVLETAGCFAAGTLVHTKEGLVPIEKIKVGDWVLSKNESGQGEREYKRVTQTFVHNEQEVMGVCFGDRFSDGTWWGDVLLATLNHPFWTETKGWVEARTFLVEKSHRSKLEVLNPDAAYTYASGRAYVTDDPHQAWVPREYGSSATRCSGEVIDLRTAAKAWDEQPDGTRRPRSGFWSKFFVTEGNMARFPSRKDLYRCTVYNLEVEDYHTCYVGQHGVWVHDKSIDS
jgi:hypothetical protein